ncbi:MAG: hypothetical protein FJZ00_14535 [Candidatus Sericytochromatia bacterium]|uniref:Uncharacterized protein n=1 Tax=Candidatus Tanganyikabacteria bacterium TaxID=2961651 RepID=A0A937X5V8_9BACT|nr:hypothetical protein [Candidatus Tanganyikabacteria bacterium]
MSHASEILLLLDRVKCSRCGEKAVRGATICLSCARSHKPIGEPIRFPAEGPEPAGFSVALMPVAHIS